MRYAASLSTMAVIWPLVVRSAMAGDDAMGGVSVGSPVPAGFAYLDASAVYRDVEIAGRSGRLVLTTCNGRVDRIRFRMQLLNDAAYLNEPTWQQIARFPYSAILGTVSSLAEALESAGWEIETQLDKQDLRRANEYVEYFKPGMTPIAYMRIVRDFSTRHLTASCVRGSRDGGGFAEFCVAELVTSVPEPCTSGL